MSLIKCRNCGKDVSTNAKECIHCGANIVSETSFVNDSQNVVDSILTISYVVVFLSVVIGIICIISGLNTEIYAYLICGIFFIIFGVLVQICLKWCAYVLLHLQTISSK